MSCCSSKKNCCETPSSTSQNATNEKGIHRHMTIEEILGMFPYKAQKLAQEISNAGLHCVGCHAATWETLEGGMIGHGKTEAEIDRLVTRLNALLEEPMDLSGITITVKAAGKFREFAEMESKQGWGIHFSEELAGCSGYEYVLDFAESAGPTDTVYHSNGIDIYVRNDQVEQLQGCEIDYLDGIRDSGFKISNPNARSSCGCGSSHGY